MAAIVEVAEFSYLSHGEASIVKRRWLHSTGGGLTAGQDFLNRINAAGVVWFHDFQSPNEVGAFRWIPSYGLDPGATQGQSANLYQSAADGVTGACMVANMPTGSGASVLWWRPLSPIQGGTTTGNGRGVGFNDPGDGGLITPLSYSPSQGGSQNNNFTSGYYAKSTYSGTTPNATWDGTEFWLFYYVKISSLINATAGNRAAVDSNGGKQCYITIMKFSGACQEIITIGNVSDGGNSGASGIAPPSGASRQAYVQLYRTTSGKPLEWDPNQGQSELAANGSQPGSLYPATLAPPYNGYLPMVNQDVGLVTNGDWHATWHWPLDTWVAVKYHVRGGTYTGSLSSSQSTTDGTNSDTLVEMFVAPRGQTSWLQIFSKSDLTYAYDVQYGWNGLILCNYPDTAQNFDTAFTRKFCQVIFSRQDIACPQA